MLRQVTGYMITAMCTSLICITTKGILVRKCFSDRADQDKTRKRLQQNKFCFFPHWKPATESAYADVPIFILTCIIVFCFLNCYFVILALKDSVYRCSRSNSLTMLRTPFFFTRGWMNFHSNICIGGLGFSVMVDSMPRWPEMYL